MLETKKDKEGKIIAFLEWNLLDDNGQFDNKGNWAWVEEVFIHKDYRQNGILKELSQIARKKIPWVKNFYFRRKKYNERQRHYSISKYLKEK